MIRDSMKKQFRKITDKLHHGPSATVHPEDKKQMSASQLYCSTSSNESVSTTESNITETLNIWDAEFWQPDLNRRQSVSLQPITIQKGRFHVTWYDQQPAIATIPNSRKPIHVRFAC